MSATEGNMARVAASADRGLMWHLCHPTYEDPNAGHEFSEA